MKPAPRLPDWEARLFSFLDVERDRPGAWGSRDCALTVASAAEAITGVHPCPELVGRYRSRAGALRQLAGKGGLSGFVTGLLGEPLPSVLAAWVGDAVLLDEDNEDRLGVCVGHLVMLRAGTGLAHRPLSKCLLAWAVGR